MPTPVSLTETSTAPSFGTAETSIRPPSGVNLIAFDNRRQQRGGLRCPFWNAAAPSRQAAHLTAPRKATFKSARVPWRIEPVLLNPSLQRDVRTSPGYGNRAGPNLLPSEHCGPAQPNIPKGPPPCGPFAFPGI